MKYVYGIFCVIALLSGLYFMMSAKSAVHEIEGLILFLIASVLIVAAEVREMASNAASNNPAGDGERPPPSDM